MVEIKEIIVATFYKFILLKDYSALRAILLDLCNKNRLRGTILLASEGINGTVAGSRQDIDCLVRYFSQEPRFAEMEYKESIVNEMPFYRMKVKLRKEIVTLAVSDVDPSKQTGKYVKPGDWNNLIRDPDVLVLDVRNQYECDIGSFKNSVTPETENFREFPHYVQQNLDPKKHKKIAMYCTGGIRCEKASAYMLKVGFEEVYQLHGGILRYLEQTKIDESQWQGECFVFDGRVAIDQHLHKGKHDQCYACRHPVSPDEMQSDKYLQGISCPYCYNSLTSERRARLEERQRQVKLAEDRNQQHIGAVQLSKNKTTV